MQNKNFKVIGTGMGFRLYVFPVTGLLQILALTLLLIVIANISYGNEKHLSPLCTKYVNKQGKEKYNCQLPYQSSYTIDDYLTVLKENLGEARVSRLDRLNVEYTGNIREIFAHSPIDLNLIFIEIRRFLGIVEKESKGSPTTELLYLLVSYLTYYKEDENISEYTKIVHTLYTCLNGWHIYEAPDMSLMRTVGRSRITISSIGGENIPQLRIGGNFQDQDINDISVMSLFEILRIGLLAGSTTWISYKSTQWLVDRIPELQGNEVVELGAGLGRRASLLELLNVNIRATDMNIKLKANPWITIEKLTANSAIRKYTEASVFLAEFPGWSIIEDTDSEGYTTMDLIADRQPVTFIWILEKQKIIQSLSKHPFISNKFDIEFIELPIEVSDFIDEDSKKLDIAMCIFRDKATAPGRKKILEIPLREEL